MDNPGPQRFRHTPVSLGYTDLDTTYVDGRRMYMTPEGNTYPSITTVLSILSRDSIAAWKARVGEVEAERKSRFARNRGTKVHDMVERYIDNQEDYIRGANPIEMSNFKDIKGIVDERLGRVILQEAPLYSDHLGLAGRVDCIGEFDGNLSIIDFKTSEKPKKKEWIKSYFMQKAAYAIMFEERTGKPIVNLVTIICNDLEHPQVFKEERDNWVAPLFDAKRQYLAEYAK